MQPTVSPFDLKHHLETLAAEFEGELRTFLSARGGEGVANLHDAMVYALGADIDDPALRGKRIRPLLCLLTADALGAPRAQVPAVTM